MNLGPEGFLYLVLVEHDGVGATTQLLTIFSDSIIPFKIFCAKDDLSSLSAAETFLVELIHSK